MGVPACLVKDCLPGEEGGDGGQGLQHSHPQLAFPANHEVYKTQVKNQQLENYEEQNEYWTYLLSSTFKAIF
jgi:hypothetical protein